MLFRSQHLAAPIFEPVPVDGIRLQAANPDIDALRRFAGRERLLRYCARPMFAAERLMWAGEGAQVRYRLPWSALQGHRVGQQRPLEL